MKTGRVSLEQIFELFEQMKRGRVTGRVIQELLDRASKINTKVLFEDAVDEARGDARAVREWRLRVNALCALAAVSDCTEDYDAAREAMFHPRGPADSDDIAHAQTKLVTAFCASENLSLHTEAIGHAQTMKSMSEHHDRAWVACIKVCCLRKLADARKFARFVNLPIFRFQAVVAIAERTKDAEDIGAAWEAAWAIGMNEPFQRCSALIRVWGLEGKRMDHVPAITDTFEKVGGQYHYLVYTQLATLGAKFGWIPGNGFEAARKAVAEYSIPGFDRACMLAVVAEASMEDADLESVRAELENIPSGAKKERAEVLRIIAGLRREPKNLEAAYIAAHGLEDPYDRAFAFIKLGKVLKESMV